MPFEIVLTLDDEDMKRFQESIDRGAEALESPSMAGQIEQAAAESLQRAAALGLPRFICERLDELQVLLDMVQDEEWKLNEEERYCILSALYYFAEPDDVIPDDVPGIGYLDDAIFAEVVCKQLHNELRLYKEFCEFRHSEEESRRLRGEDPAVGREEWIAAKRADLHRRLRERRILAGGGRGWRLHILRAR